MYDFEPLWKTMDQKGISTYQLIHKYGFSKGTLDSLKHNRNVTMHTIDFLCQLLEAPVESIVHVSPDEFRDHSIFYYKNYMEMRKKRDAQSKN